MAKIGRYEQRKFAEKLQQDPCFSVLLDDKKTWLCPYCAAPAVEDRNAENFSELALKHIYEGCSKTTNLDGLVLTLRQLNETVLQFRLKALCAKEPSWRLRTPTGEWLCPFCAEPTQVRMVDRSGALRPVDDLVHDFQAHFARCYAHNQHPNVWLSVDEIRAAIAERNRQEQELRTVTERMRSDPVYGFDDGHGHWICPFCEQIVPAVDFSTPFARQHAAAPQILEHFNGGLCTYRGSLDSGKSLEQMQAVVAKLTGAGKAAKDKGAAEPGAASPPPAYLETLKSELEELRSHLGQNKKMQDDLERARKAQQRMLPAKAPDIEGYEIDVFFCGCEAVSGDFYDFIPLPDGRVGIVMGDISGHGVDAGMVMCMAKKAFSLRAQSGADPVTVAAQVNADIRPELETATFVTALYGILDPILNVFSFVRCGHTFPVLYHAESRTVEDVASEGVVLGSVRDPMFTNKTKQMDISFDPGDSVTLFTDGITEAMTETSEEFGPELTREAIARHGPCTAKGIVEGLIGAIRIFTKGFTQADDQTLIVIRRKTE